MAKDVSKAASDVRKRKQNEKIKVAQDDNKKADAVIENATDEVKPELPEQLPDDPFHVNQSSLLSNTSGFNNYRGFLNLCIVLLAMSSGRLVLENLIKYGILVDPIAMLRLFLSDPYSLPSALLASLINAFVLNQLVVEKLAAKGLISDTMCKCLSFLNITTLIVFPAVVITVIKTNPFGGIFVSAIYTITFLKMISYTEVNKWCRTAMRLKKTGNRGGKLKGKKQAKNKNEVITSSNNDTTVARGTKENGSIVVDTTQLVKYPNNLNLKDLYYFLLAPTLCYELNFPRTPRIRKRFLLRRIVELLFLTHLSMALIQQWIVPTVMNAMKPFSEMDLKRMIERILKLAVPNHFIWLMFFYFYFHSFLNIIAELLRFGDREFYRDWWNSESVGYFWRNWNIPTYNWCRRHVYRVLLRKGYSKISGQIVVFLLSAIFHEYLLSVPLHMFRLWGFMGMILQIPLAIFVGTFLKGYIANMVVWVVIIIGQPIAVLMYVHDYYIENYIAANATTVT